MTEIDLEQFEGHTKGPWTDYTAQEVGIKGTRGYCDYCIAIMDDSDMKRPERIANRKLIASAPALLEEVRQLRKELEACPDCLGYGGLDATDCGGPYIECESCKGSGTREE